MRHRGWRRQADARLDEFAMPDDPVPAHPQAINADDELINSVVQGRLRRAATWPGGRDPDDQLVAMLSAWRADAASEPLRTLISAESARAAIARGRSRRRIVPLALVAGLLVVVGTGLTIGAGSAQPGDPLWGLSRIVDSDRAESVTVALKVQAQLSTVRTALAQGRTDVAAAALAEIQAELPAVRPEEGREALAAEQRDLAAQLAQTPPGGPTTPPDPAAAGPTPSDGPPPDVLAEQPPPAGPPPASGSPSAAGTPPAGPPPADPPPAEPPPADPPPTDEPAAVDPAPAEPAEARQPQTAPPPPARRPLLDLQPGNLRIGLL